MKRCPQCLFLYPDADERCDFDKTPLEVVDEATIDAATRPAKKRRLMPVVAAVVLMAGLFVFAIYYGVSQRRTTSAATQNSTTVAPVASPEAVVPTLPSPSPSVSPSPSPSPSAKPSIAPTTASHSRATTDPVSTSGPGIGTRQGGKPVIVLTSGGRIDADEVWRTKDGVWYRRNGMVTLLKRSQVKTILTK
ncbi:MAG TPA: hypothetical protein VFY60_09935 [Pyrinomonadaceae bacterium]|nr:hypothetical protein [Pyrinomonadaceae bacterium]